VSWLCYACHDSSSHAAHDTLQAQRRRRRIGEGERGGEEEEEEVEKKKRDIAKDWSVHHVSAWQHYAVSLGFPRAIALQKFFSKQGCSTSAFFCICTQAEFTQERMVGDTKLLPKCLFWQIQGSACSAALSSWKLLYKAQQSK